MSDIVLPPCSVCGNKKATVQETQYESVPLVVKCSDEYCDNTLPIDEWQEGKLVRMCGSCEELFENPNDGNCPHCGSGNWVNGYIDLG